MMSAICARWLEEARDAAADVGKFGKWLVAKKYLTEYQLGQLLRGRIEHLFLGEYKLLDRLGQGRMAGVYQAAHRLGQPVAIKVLPPSKAKDPQLLARFQREARLAVRLKHPNVVRTFHIAETDGLHYIVMEYLEGDTLEDVLQRRGKLPPAECACKYLVTARCESSPRFGLNLVTERNCVAARQGGEQREVNDSSVG